MVWLRTCAAEHHLHKCFLLSISIDTRSIQDIRFYEEKIKTQTNDMFRLMSSWVLGCGCGCVCVRIRVLPWIENWFKCGIASKTWTLFTLKFNHCWNVIVCYFENRDVYILALCAHAIYGNHKIRNYSQFSSIHFLPSENYTFTVFGSIFILN